MTAQLRIRLVLISAGLLTTVVSAFLPWTWNSVHGGTLGIVQMWGLYAGVLLLQVLAVVAAFRRSGWSLLPAVVAAVAVIIAMVITPRGVMMWDGVDKFGRPTGGMEVTTLGYGASVALLGVLIVLAGLLWAWLAEVRSPRNRGRRELGHPGEGPNGVTGRVSTADGAGGRHPQQGAAGRPLR